MAQATGNFAKLLWPGLNKVWTKAGKDRTPEWTSLVDQYTSRQNWEEELSMSGYGLPVQKQEGDAVTFDVMRQGFLQRYTHAVWALGFSITRELFEDDLYDVVGEKKAKKLQYSMLQGKETNVANLYNRAFNSTYTFADGKEILATDHVFVGGGTFANELSTAADLSEASLEQAFIDIQKYADSRGLKEAIKPVKLIVPVDLWPEAEKLLETQYEVGTANNTVSVVYKKIPMIVNHYLTDTDAWFIRTDADDGLKLFQRRPLQFDMDNDWDTENAKFKASERYAVGITNVKALFGSPGA